VIDVDAVVVFVFPYLDTVLLNEEYRLNTVLFMSCFPIQAVLKCSCSLQASLTRPNKAA